MFPPILRDKVVSSNMKFGMRFAKYAALAGVGCIALYGVYQNTLVALEECKLKNLLDEEVDMLATDFVSDDGRREGDGELQVIAVTPEVAGADGTIMIGDLVCPVVADGSVTSGESPIKVMEKEPTECSNLVDPVRGVARLNLTKVEVDHHRRVERAKRVPYMNTVIAECRLTFGVPVRNDANEKAVRRVAVKLMKTHGVRPSHMNTMLPTIVETVFIPSNYDIEARRLSTGWAAWLRIQRWTGLSFTAGRC